MENVLEIKNLNKKYEKFELKNINLNIPKGTIMGIIGENGAGKTTTIKAILNIIKSDSGNIRIFGKNAKENEKEVKENIGVVLDDSFLSEYLTPVDIDKIMKKIYKNWNKELYFNYLEQFNIPIKKQIKDFSSGMKMKLKIIVAISHHPQFLILDEPTSGLDPVARNEILDIFHEFIQNENNSILISSHITSDLEHIADYITFINRGEILLSKLKDELLEEYGIVKCSAQDFESIDRKDYLCFKKEKYEVQVLVSNKHNFKNKYESLIIDKANLEDIMLLYIKGDK